MRPGPCSGCGSSEQAVSLLAADLERVLEVLRSPRDATGRMWFPLTELLLLSGLRWGEGAGLRWPDVSERGGLVYVQRAVARGRWRRRKSARGPRVGIVQLAPVFVGSIPERFVEVLLDLVASTEPARLPPRSLAPG